MTNVHNNTPFTLQEHPGLNRLLGNFATHTHPVHYDCSSCHQDQQRCPQDLIDNGQFGKVMTAFNGCSDSRGNPAVVFRPGMGDMFPVINAGAFLTPYEDERGATQAWASLEYAITALKVRDIVQFGHTECGAMAGLVAQAQHMPPGMKHLAGLLRGVSHLVQEAGQLFVQRHGYMPDPAQLQREVELHNVRTATRHLRDYVKAYHPDADVRVHGWLYDLRGANILALQQDGAFAPITHLPHRADYGQLPSSCGQGVAQRAHRLVFRPRAPQGTAAPGLRAEL